MSEEFQVNLPKLGESILSATIVQWFKSEGEFIKKDEPLLEVSTDKVNSEIPSPISGTLKQILAEIDQELSVGDPLAVISLSKAASDEKANMPSKRVAVTTSSDFTAANSSEMKDFFTPALLRLAREKGVSMNELESISGTGAGGRITKKDLEEYLENKVPKMRGCPSAALSKPTPSEEIERIKMSGMRKAIAENMVRSFYEAPHAALISEVDVTEVMKTIQKEKETFLEKHGAKLTITCFLARAIARAIQEYPLINSSLEHDTIVMKRFVNLGIAVSVDQGILVPVIKQCHRLSLIDIAKMIQDLSMKARSGKLSPDEVKEGTITLTNFGISGVLMGIPIIRYPEVAIVGMGAAHKKVVVLDDDTFGVRWIVNISLTFDHRVLDGMYGCGFVASLKKHLEEDVTLE